MSDEDAEKPVIKPAAEPVTSTTFFSMQTVPANTTGSMFEQAKKAVAASTIDHGGQQSITALGVTPKQLEKFEIEGIRTVSQFERALADRSIENVRGIQERTMDKLRESLWEFRKQHPIPDPDDRPVLTASVWEDGFGLARGELHGKPEATEITPELCEKAKGAGRSAGISGVNATENPHEEGSVLGDHWDSGWDEGCAERLDFMQLASANQETTPAPEPESPVPALTTDRPKPFAIIGSINLATDPLTSPLANIILQAGRDARTAGFSKLDNPLRTGASVHREDLWNDGWDEMDQELKEKSATQAVAAEKPEKPEKPARKPRAKKAKTDAGSEATDGTEATKPE